MMKTDNIDDEPIVKKISRYDPVACKKYYDKPDVKARKKVEYENNREKISEYQKQYYLKNREKVQCKFCGNEMFKKSLKKHQKSFHSLNFYAIFTN